MKSFGEVELFWKMILKTLPGKLGLKIKSRRVNEAFDEIMRVWLPLPKATFRAIARAPSARTAFQRHHRWKISLLFSKNPRNMKIIMTRKCSLFIHRLAFRRWSFEFSVGIACRLNIWGWNLTPSESSIWSANESLILWRRRFWAVPRTKWRCFSWRNSFELTRRNWQSCECSVGKSSRATKSIFWGKRWFYFLLHLPF